MKHLSYKLFVFLITSKAALIQRCGESIYTISREGGMKIRCKCKHNFDTDSEQLSREATVFCNGNYTKKAELQLSGNIMEVTLPDVPVSCTGLIGRVVISHNKPNLTSYIPPEIEILVKDFKNSVSFKEIKSTGGSHYSMETFGDEKYLAITLVYDGTDKTGLLNKWKDDFVLFIPKNDHEKLQIISSNYRGSDINKKMVRAKLIIEQTDDKQTIMRITLLNAIEEINFKTMHLKLGNATIKITTTSNTFLLLIFAPIGALLVLILIAYNVYSYIKDKRPKQDLLADIPLLSQKPSLAIISDESNQQLFESFVNELDDEQMKFEMKKMYIPNDTIERSDTKLGKGQSGQAFLAKYQNRQVCVKICTPVYSAKPGTPYQDNQESADVSKNIFKEIFKEAYKMRQFEHQNVMRVIGVSLNSRSAPEIVLPLMDERDLLAYLRNRNSIISYKEVYTF